jgi:hypothetical protein
VGAASSTFYTFSQGGNINLALSQLSIFFGQLKTLLPASITITIPQVGQLYDDVTGQLLGTWTGAAQASATGTAAGAFGSASGGVVKWITPTIARRHALQGRTFIVPMASSAFNATGVLAPSSVTTMVSAAGQVVTGGVFRIWSRPTPLHALGVSGLITGANVPNFDAVLRSRRK